MMSAGNDIVALEIIDRQRSSQPAFYSKILSAGEQALYRQEDLKEMFFDLFLWLLWSVKESVYKYKKRTSPSLSFCPAKIILQSIDLPSGRSLTDFTGRRWENTGYEEDEFYKGIILFGSEIFYSRSIIHRQLISTVVSSDRSFEGILWGLEMIDQPGYERQSAAVRAFALSKLERIAPGHDWQIIKSPVGYPIVLQGGRETDIPLSLAHHGRFVGYSFLSVPFLSSPSQPAPSQSSPSLPLRPPSQMAARS
ncbi:MAG TPA: 4'-phosphopantetheinyl transferase superfamily protein [Puia sp.]|nr:4'-phosphopantetheinyl transferase superfamily protein [Puia sp.]